MKQKEILLFGGTGQIGRNLVRKLSENNYKITVVTRNLHQSGYILKTQANPGYLNLIEMNNFNMKKVSSLMENVDICINLVGILYEKKKNEFKLIHTDFPNMLSKLAKTHQIKKFIHLSSLGIENAIDSKYAQSKLEGENTVRNNFSKSIILKPSIVYSVDDKFTTNFMSLLSLLPFMPLYYSGKTKFIPIHVIDLVNIIMNVIEIKSEGITIECVGPETLSFKELLRKLLRSINKKRLLIPLPMPIAKFSAKLLQLFPKPILTEDQLRTLKYDNILSGKYKSNFDIGIKAEKFFENEINKYSFNWRSGGQFSKETKKKIL